MIMVSGWDYRDNSSDTVCITVAMNQLPQYIQIKTFRWSTHEIKFTETFADITQFSGISYPEKESA